MGETRSEKVCITDLYGNNLAGVDEKSKGLYKIGTFHHKIHEGRAFYATKIFDNISDDATASISFELDSTSFEAHLDIECFAGGDTFVYLYEDCTHDDGGEVISRNFNRAISDEHNLTFKHTPTGGNQGTLIEEIFIPGGTGVGSVGGASGSRVEFIFNPTTHTKYMVVAINKSGGVSPISFKFSWYEVAI